MKAVGIAVSILFLTSFIANSEAQSLQATSSTDVVAKANRKPPVIKFPQDLYDHPTFQTEWWYFTGNLHSRNNKEYGFELTFFRTNQPTGAPAGEPQVQPVIFADLAVSDINGQQFFFHKSLAPEKSPLASITEKPWSIQLGPWQLKQPLSALGVFQLKARQDDFGVNLFLQPQVPPVLHGDKGLFELDGSDGQGSEFFEYYSIPRLKAAGSITVNGEAIPVEGLAWNDHEYFTLKAGQDTFHSAVSNADYPIAWTTDPFFLSVFEAKEVSLTGKDREVLCRRMAVNRYALAGGQGQPIDREGHGTVFGLYLPDKVRACNIELLTLIYTDLANSFH
ncbi:carotenoid 1,2-hydratase [Granulicella sp. dw_53]|uniref:carotenoid 1,2-hydratase n=1 Tax=Granulicella sp. dw_53 TaxID=2719792 RepID=UPI001BD6A4C6|nr:carotenoid 1,2-hydratase [Granulicella sp. dw_53]